MGFLLPVLFGMVGCVLLISCVNVTNVMLARASARRHETAVRIALGASRARIARQWLIEHLLVFVGAGTLGRPCRPCVRERSAALQSLGSISHFDR